MDPAAAEWMFVDLFIQVHQASPPEILIQGIAAAGHAGDARAALAQDAVVDGGQEGGRLGQGGLDAPAGLGEQSLRVEANGIPRPVCTGVHVSDIGFIGSIVNRQKPLAHSWGPFEVSSARAP